MSSNQSSTENLLETLNAESEKLQNKISESLQNSKTLNIEAVIQLYFQVINVSSLVKSLNKDYKIFEKEISKQGLKKIQKTEQLIDRNFNKKLHPMLKSQLEKTIEAFKSDLKIMETNFSSKTKKEIETQAEKFEKLRQLMSTKEFIEQYDRILENYPS